MMQPLMYCTVSETPSSPSPPIGPVPTSAQLKEEGASSTGKEPPSVYWTPMVLCVHPSPSPPVLREEDGTCIVPGGAW